MILARVTTSLLILFWPLTALVLFCDSRVAAQWSTHGQLLSNLLAPVFLLALMTQLPPHRRLVVALFVPLSAIGEILFSLVFGFYHYRLDAVPLYVPFGHSILMSAGFLLAESEFVCKNRKQVQNALLVFHGSLIAATLIFRGDTLSTLWAAMFLVLLRKRAAEPFYLILGVLVLYVEIIGTLGGCWVWRPDSFGVLHTVNPPPGAFTCYVIGDILAIIIAAQIGALLSRRAVRQAPAVDFCAALRRNDTRPNVRALIAEFRAAAQDVSSDKISRVAKPRQTQSQGKK